MESLQAFRHCMCRNLLPQNISPRSSSNPSRALKHPHGRRKSLTRSWPTRSLTTTSPRCQVENSSTTTPQPQQEPQPPPSPTSTAPRPSAWGSLFQGLRPHGTSLNTSAADRDALSQKLEQRVNALDIIPERKSSRSTPPTGAQLLRQVEQEINTLGARNTHAALSAVHLRLTPMLGRTLQVEPSNGLDLQSAFRVLEMRCALNNVKKDSHNQATHVRKGQLRKMLKSKRWRALFMRGFLKELGRVRRMKRQGW